MVCTLLLLGQQHPSHLKARVIGASLGSSHPFQATPPPEGWFPCVPRGCAEGAGVLKKLPPSGFQWHWWALTMGSPHTEGALPLLISVLYTPRTVDYKPPTKRHHHQVPGCKRCSWSAALSDELQGCNLLLTTQALYSESRGTSHEAQTPIAFAAHTMCKGN